MDPSRPAGQTNFSSIRVMSFTGAMAAREIGLKPERVFIPEFVVIC
jgi:hypothetical protein